MNATLNQIPRAEKLAIAKEIRDNLEARAKKGPPEAALDDYVPELAEVCDALGTHVTGNTLADAARAARLALLDQADDDVDTLYRHVEGYVDVESRRRTGPHVAAAGALHAAAFPDGLAHVDDPIAGENRICRAALAVLRSDAQAPVVKAIQLPEQWLVDWEAALDKSDALLAEVEQARRQKRAHVGAGQDAEGAWVETMVRLRRYVASRAKKSDKARIQEGRELLAPLLEVMSRLRAVAAARATKRETSQPLPSSPPPA